MIVHISVGSAMAVVHRPTKVHRALSGWRDIDVWEQSTTTLFWCRTGPPAFNSCPQSQIGGAQRGSGNWKRQYYEKWKWNGKKGKELKWKERWKERKGEKQLRTLQNCSVSEKIIMNFLKRTVMYEKRRAGKDGKPRQLPRLTTSYKWPGNCWPKSTIQKYFCCLHHSM